MLGIHGRDRKTENHFPAVIRSTAATNSVKAGRGKKQTDEEPVYLASTVASWSTPER